MGLKSPYELSGKVAVVTGGTGVLCSVMARALGDCGAKVAVLGRNMEKADRIVAEIRSRGGEAISVRVDVTDRPSIEAAAQQVTDAFGRVDVLINGAGGAREEATTSDERSFFDLSDHALRGVFDLNCLGTIMCSQVFGRYMAEQGSGCIINISSMAALRPLTRAVAYSAAKAAVSNFTQWLAVHMSQNYSKEIRVNAIAPGFFLTEQNRFLLIDEASNELTERAKTILAHTPMGRFGDPEDLIGTVLWLASEGAHFIHGAVIPVDGGFSAFGGV
ncbi:MAG: SDR family oxidoreductase [Candidatus Bathyarchaeota archaeon]|nr:SDR family oxidoreductase [Candidatus Bathyarchaeota archaeon]